MKYRLEVLTPTLIGDGDKLSPIDYMVWRDQVNVLDQKRIFTLLARGPRLEGYLTQLQKATRLDFASWGGFAQNFAGRRIPFEDPVYTNYWNKAQTESLNIPTFASSGERPFVPGAAIKGALRSGFVFANATPDSMTELMTRLGGDRPVRRPAENIEQQSAGVGGTDRLRAVSVADSASVDRDSFRVYMLRTSTLQARGPGQYSLGWKQAGRGSVDGKKPEDSTPMFAEMAAPGTSFHGIWQERTFLNDPPVRHGLRWNAPVTSEGLFENANRYAEKQLDLHALYAQWTGLESLAQSVAGLRSRLESARASSRCLLALGWGAGFLSKSSLTGVESEEYRRIIGSLPYYERAIKSGLPFPKTRKIVFLKNRPAALAGWVELSVE